MRKEDIELCEKDMCARLPYVVYVTVDVVNYLKWLPDDDDENRFKEKMKTYLKAVNKTEEDISKERTTLSGYPCGGRFETRSWCNEDFGIPVEFIKPFYRRMSNMTEKEEKEYRGLLMSGPYYAVTDWLDKHMFDYRGLIDKGFAQEAPADMYIFLDDNNKLAYYYKR